MIQSFIDFIQGNLLLLGVLPQPAPNFRIILIGLCTVNSPQKSVLHVGSGYRNNVAFFPPAFKDWKEIRLDINPDCKPDLCCSMLDMKPVADNSVDAIYSSHNIEHVHTHEVHHLLKEFLRVLKPTGFLLVTCPDLQAIGQMIADDKLEDIVYTSPAGPITPLDILFGLTGSVATGNVFMQHKTGFTKTTLSRKLLAAGFKYVAAKRRVRKHDLWAIALKMRMMESNIRDLSMRFMPQ